MEHVMTPTFTTPGFAQRVNSMLRVDLYRMSRTPLLYVMLAVSAALPAICLVADGSGGLYENAWNIIAAEVPACALGGIGVRTDMNVVFALGGIMTSAFIGRDFRSGYVKQLFTAHAMKRDYMISKSLVCALAMLCMCVVYFAAGAVAVLAAGTCAPESAGALMQALFGKMVMCFGWAGLYVFLNVLLRGRFFVAAVLSFLAGTGVPQTGVAGLLGTTPAWGGLLYGASANACRTSGGVTLLICAAVSLAWTLIYNVLGTASLAGRDPLRTNRTERRRKPNEA